MDRGHDDEAEQGGVRDQPRAQFLDQSRIQQRRHGDAARDGRPKTVVNRLRGLEDVEEDLLRLELMKPNRAPVIAVMARV